MKADFHFHFYSRILIMAVLAVFLVLANRSVETKAGPTPPYDISGWSWSESVGWVSLNCYNDFNTPGTFEDRCNNEVTQWPTNQDDYGLELGDSAGSTVVTGCAWAGSYLNDSGVPLGWICFSDPGSGLTEAPTFGIPLSATYINALSPSAYASIVSQQHYRCSPSGDSCDPSYPVCPGSETCNLVNDGAWKLGFPIKDQVTSVGTGVGQDPDYPSSGNPLSGCFNCSQQYVDYYCVNTPSWPCDSTCDGTSDPNTEPSCLFPPGSIWEETLDFTDCPSVNLDGVTPDTCQATDIDYNCDNCLEYFYYTKADSLAYGNGYIHRRAITINGDQIAGNLSNFPVLISFDRLDITTNVESSAGYDIIFTTDAEGTVQLPHQVEKYSSTGEVVIWVKLDLVAGTDKTFYMFYGNSAIIIPTEIGDVWDNNYLGVWHLDEDSGSYLDSAVSSNHSTSIVGNDSRSDNCQIAGCPIFDGFSSRIEFTDLHIGSNYTISAWVAVDDFYNPLADNGIICKASGVASANIEYCLATADSGANNGFEIYSNGGYQYSNVNKSESTWYHVVATYNGTHDMYVDGSLDESSSGGSGVTSVTQPLVFGSTWNDRYFDGYIDEVHISSIARNTDWITTEYNNQNSPGDFYSIGADVSVREGSLKKVLGGYDCTDCTIENYDNVCGLNTYADNINRCNSCAEVYQTPGVMIDYYNDIEIGESANLCGWAWNGWGSGQGLGWFQFEPRVVTSTRPYISIEGGSIYSKGKLYSRYSPPFNKYSASYLIESGNSITNFISGKTLSGEYQGEFPYSPSIDFFNLADNGKYENALGSIDYYGLVTKLGSTDYNKYEAQVVELTTVAELLIELNDPLEAKVIRVSPVGGMLTLTDSNTIYIQSGSGNVSGAGVIIVEGDLKIMQNIEYQDDSFVNLKNIPSVVWLVKGDIYIAPTVDTIVGTFIVVGDGVTASCNAPSSCDQTSIEGGSDTGCGQFASCFEVNPGDCGVDSSTLTVNGSVIARLFELCRGAYDADNPQPAEKFVNDGRLQANPPPGFTDFSKVIPRFY